MTTHELARQLLAGPDIQVRVEDDGMWRLPSLTQRMGTYVFPGDETSLDWARPNGTVPTMEI